MTKFFSAFTICSILLQVSCFASPLPFARILLPDAGSYEYWIQSSTGAISLPPTKTVGKITIVIESPNPASRLFVLDYHNGQLASINLSNGLHEQLLGSNFQSIVSTIPVTALHASNPPSPVHQQTGGVAIFIDWLMGIAVAAGVIWFVMSLLQTRGGMLIGLANRLGIDVPDPNKPQTEDVSAAIEQPVRNRPLQKIPEEASAPPSILMPNQPSSLDPGLPISRPTYTQQPQIIGYSGNANGTSMKLDQETITIGRDGDNSLVLMDDSVSRHHARLVRAADGVFTLHDEGSANGTIINGRRVAEAFLAPGDHLQIGNNYFRVEA